MSALAEKISALIKAQGPISVAQFMGMALQEYYGKADVFGPKGDFVTAPEISQMFGEMLGIWVVQQWAVQGKPRKFHLVELGPGRGTLMADALRAAKRVMPDFDPDVVLIESSDFLKNIQRIKLEGARVRWSHHFDEELEGLPLFLIANEFFDALPINQIIKTETGWHERVVTDEPAFALAPIPVPNALIPADRHGGEVGSVYEVCPSGIAYAQEIAGVIADRGGAALIVDYGYAEVGFGETLQAMAGHKFVGLLDSPGDVDLSAHVDFRALKQAAEKKGVSVYGPVEQGHFLKAIGIEARAGHLIAKNPHAAEEVGQALERLTAPEAMGRMFKAMAIVPSGASKPPGF